MCSWWSVENITMNPFLASLVYAAVVFFGRRKMQESLGWMAGFWTSIAGQQEAHVTTYSSPVD